MTFPGELENTRANESSRGLRSARNCVKPSYEYILNQSLTNRLSYGILNLLLFK